MTHVSDEQLGKFARQQAELFRRVREGSVDVEYASRSVQCIIEYKLRVESQTFTIEVNYDQNIDDSLKAGNYDSVLHDFTGGHFPVTRCCGINTVELHLMHCNKKVTSEEILEELEKQGLRPAIIEELLAFGADLDTRDLQNLFPIIGLGSVYTYPDGCRYVTTLNSDDIGRIVYMRGFSSVWALSNRFLAVRK